jgi:hypothetical protein
MHDESTVRVPLMNSKEFALIDAEDADLVLAHQWFLVDGYAATVIDGKVVFMHDLVMAAQQGEA